MAYKITREKQLVEDLELTDESGNVVEVIHVRLNPDAVVENVSKKYTELLNVHANLSKITEQQNKAEAFEQLGNAVVELFSAVFGEEDTAKIIDFYSNNYIEMCRNVTPFITQVVIPQVRKMAQNNRKAAMQKYNRKQSRLLVRKK